MIRHQSGALLLLVALLLATLAALSFGLNRATGMDAASLQADYEARAAGYLAEAAVAAATWSNGAAGCKSERVAATTLGTGHFEATVAKAGSKNVDIVATGTAGNGTVRRIERTNVPLIDFSKKPTSTDLGGAAIDTTVDAFRVQPEADRTDLALVSGTSQALLYWPVNEIAAESRVMSATLILAQNGAAGAARPVAVHRMTTAWDATATWRYARYLLVAWSGGDYAGSAVATAAVAGAGTYSWDVTALVDGWSTGRLPNHGMLLRMALPGQAATFFSRDAAAKQRPVLRVVTAKAC